MRETNGALSAMSVLKVAFRVNVIFTVMIFAPSIQAESAKIPLSASINTARPSFSGPATTLETGHWQWEGGYQYTSNDDAGSDTETHTLPFLLLRIGVNERTEISLGCA